MTDILTSLQANPFYVLQVTTRDRSQTIVEAAEERSLHIDHDICQKARSDLTNPRTRLAAEIAWMPGVAPSMAEQMIQMLENSPIFARDDTGLQELPQANLMAAAIELVKDYESAHSIAAFICNFCWTVESIDPEEVLRDVNEERLISGFPEVRSLNAIEEELAERRKFYKSILKALLDRLEPSKLIEIMTDAVETATQGGEVHGPALLDDLVDSYEIETQGFLQKEYENLAELIARARAAAPMGESAVSPIIDILEHVARNWDHVAQPIQVSAKSRGIVHRQSRDVAFELRELGIDLNNDFGMLQLAHRMTELLQEIFAELAEVTERLEEDAEAIIGLRQEAVEREKRDAEWAHSITFQAEVGVLFKDKLSISPDGIRWKDSHYPLESITRVRWGGINRSSTGTEYVIAFGDNKTEGYVSLRKQATYSNFLDALWRGVCIRLMLELLQALSNGKSFSFGDITVEDSFVTLTRHKLFGNERVRLTWGDVHIWSSNGSFVIGQQGNSKVYGSSSYIENFNTHILEYVIRGGFEKGVHKLSDFLKD